MRYVGLCLILLLLLPLTASAQQPINYGDTVTGSISSDTPILEYQFAGTAGDVITILMEATEGSALDSYLRLLDSTGEVLTENDDAADVTIDAAINSFALPADDTYTIQASRYGLEGGISTGDFQLTLMLESGETPQQENTEVPSEANTIIYNTPVTGTINAQTFEERWQFSGTEGDEITIRMSRVDPASNLDTFLYLLDSEGNELAQNDDAALSDDLSTSEILNFDLPYTGTYTIVATRYGGAESTSTGDYTLEILTRDEPSAVPTEELPGGVQIEGQAVRYGMFVQDSLEANAAPKIYDFEGQAGDIVTISVKRQSGDFDPVLTLRDEGGNVIAANSRFNGASDARIVGIELTSAGTYHIEVQAERGSSGDFVLYLMEADTVVSAASPEPAVTEEFTPEATQAPDLTDAVLTIILSWNSTADFDLQVTEPDGAAIDYFNPEAESGGAFGGDANGGCSQTQESPSETVYWENEPPAGMYEIGVAYVFPCGASDPVPFTITISRNGEVIETIEGELNQGGFQSYEWTLE